MSTPIDAARKVLANKQAEEFDGVLLDTFSASAIVQVHDNIRESNKNRLNAMSVEKAASFCLKLLAKVS